MEGFTKTDLAVGLTIISLGAGGTAFVFTAGARVILVETSFVTAFGAAAIDPEANGAGFAVTVISRGVIKPTYGEAASSLIDSYNNLFSLGGLAEHYLNNE